MRRRTNVPLLALPLLIGLLASALPGTAQEAPTQTAPDNLVLADATGDPGPFGLGVEGNPAMTAYQHIDITSLEIGNDDPTSFQIAYTFVGFDQTTTTPAQALALLDFQCQTFWTYEHDIADAEYNYELIFSGSLTRIPGSPPSDFDVDFGFEYETSNTRMGYGWNWGADIEFDGTDTITATIDKGFAPVWPGGENAVHGDTLILLEASCRTDVALYGHIYDYVDVPDGATYDFVTPGPGDIIHVRFADQAGSGWTVTEPTEWSPPDGAQAIPTTSVGPASTTVIPVIVENRAETRKLVQLSATFADGPAAGWNATLLPSVLLASGETRAVSLIVTPPADVALGTSRPMQVHAQAAGEDLQGLALRNLKVVPALDEKHNTFHLHSRAFTPADPVDEVLYKAIPAQDILASLLENVDGYPNEPAPIGTVTYWGSGEYLDPLVHGVTLDPDTPIVVEVAFDGAPERLAYVEMTLSTAEGVTVFNLEESVPADGVTRLETFLAADEATYLPAGTRLYFYVRVGPSGVGPESATDAYFLAGDSFFTLPAARDASETVITDGRFLPTLALAPGDDRTAYINPGKTYTYDLVLANEGIETDDLTVNVNATNASGWQVQIRPGSTYRVSPGNSTPVSLVVVAPEDAAEGAHPKFEVRATSKHDGAAHTRIVLDAIVTSGVQIDDKTYTEKENQIAPLDESAEAPGGPVAILLVILALGLVGVRRFGRAGRQT